MLHTYLRAAAHACAALLLAGCYSTLDHAPGPEDPALIAAARGTLVLAPSGDGLLNETLTLVDLPSLRSRALRVPGGWDHLGGVDAEGRVAYLVREGGDHVLRVLDAGADSASTLARLPGGRPWRVALAPAGGRLALWANGAAGVEIVELSPPARRPLAVDVGGVDSVHWLPDGGAVAIDGSAGGVLVDVASAAVLERAREGYGPFSPDGDTFLRRSGEELVLVERASGRTLAAPARFPFPLGGAAPHGLCARQLALYTALPTEGGPGGHSLARGGVLVHEDGVIKVSDVESGAYATVRVRGGEIAQVLFGPRRSALLAAE